MQIRNHIAYRYLTDDSLAHEALETSYPEEYERVSKNQGSEEDIAKLSSFYQLISKQDQKAYYITNTVLDKLDMLKVNKKEGKYDWTVFKYVGDAKYTFIFKDNKLLRIRFSPDMISCQHTQYNYYSKEEKIKYKVPGQIYWINFYMNRKTGEQCDHFNHVDVQGGIETLVYHLLCFFFLSDNTEILVNAGKSYGTKKQTDALCNDCDVPIIIVNSNWNITSIRTEGFNVSGHFRLQLCGPQMSQTKMIFIEPFKKHGYVRHATNTLIK